MLTPCAAYWGSKSHKHRLGLLWVSGITLAPYCWVHHLCCVLTMILSMIHWYNLHIKLIFDSSSV
ncbi:hypothetical protein BJX76DRAFT_327406 [Aspergillus varians]